MFSKNERGGGRPHLAELTAPELIGRPQPAELIAQSTPYPVDVI